MRTTISLSLFALVACVCTHASADVILDAQFVEPGYDESANTTGTTANNLPWTSAFGETASSSMTFGGSATSFIDGGSSDADALGISGNIETAGSWNTSFAFTPTQDYILDDLTILGYAISGGGTHQGGDHAYQFTANIDGTTGLGTVEHLETGGDTGSTFVLNGGAGTLLSAGTTYTFNLVADVGPSDPANTGNNIGLGSITLNGTTAVPEPGSMCVLALGLTFIGMRRRRNQA